MVGGKLKIKIVTYGVTEIRKDDHDNDGEKKVEDNDEMDVEYDGN